MTRKDYKVVAELVAEIEGEMGTENPRWATDVAVVFLRKRFANFDEWKFLKYINAL